MKKTVVKFGTISGVILAILMSVTIPFMDKSTNSTNAELIGFAGMIVAFSLIFVAIIQHRNQAIDGAISFGKAFRIGLYISLIASTFYVVTWMIISEFILPDFMDNYIEATIAKINESDFSDTEKMEQINEYEKMADWYKNPSLKFLFTYVEVLPVGILISLIASIVLKKKAN